jgi:hypothetical protein
LWTTFGHCVDEVAGWLSIRDEMLLEPEGVAALSRGLS